MDAGLSLFDKFGEVDISARMVINVLVSLAQNERDLISKRTKSGLRQAKANGKVLGAKTTDEAVRVKKMMSDGISVKEVLKSTALSRSQVYKIKAKLK